MRKCVGFLLGSHEVLVRRGGHEGGGKNKATWVKHGQVILESPN